MTKVLVASGERTTTPALFVALALAALGAGCGREFTAFNELDKLRVLGVRAEPPALGPGGSAVLEALVFEPDGDPIAWRWSWCPLAAGGQTGFECVLDEERLRQMADAMLPGAGALIPSFDLGDGPEAEFRYPLAPDLLRALCEAATSQELPAFVPLPDCSRGIDVSVRLEVSAGGETVVAVKDLPLYWDAADADNENPPVAWMTAALGGAAAGEIQEDGGTALEPGAAYDLVVGVELAAAQLFTPPAVGGESAPEPRRERLFMTWFVTGGELDFKRTTFIDGEVGLDVLERNRWRPPREEETPDGAASIFVVLQDERGGVGWLGRTVLLERR
jgi:hypothetical protein